MKAIVCRDSSLVFTDAEKPAVEGSEVLVRIRAATVTPSDVTSMGSLALFRLFAGRSKPKQAIPGVEFAGEVEAVGPAARRFKAGDKVFGSSLGYGSWAEYIRLSDGGTLAPMPSGMDYAQAVGICDGAVTALLFLRDLARVAKGQKVLINGASGSVGTYAVQLARHFGAEVTGVCGTANIELVKSLGADRVIDYTAEDFTQCGGVFDIVFDAVGKSSFSRCRGLLNATGIYDDRAIAGHHAPEAVAFQAKRQTCVVYRRRPGKTDEADTGIAAAQGIDRGGKAPFGC